MNFNFFYNAKGLKRAKSKKFDEAHKPHLYIINFFNYLKILRRMQVGNQVSPNSRSVGQRIKEASLKENVQHSNNGANNNSNGTLLAHSHNHTDVVINCSTSTANYCKKTFFLKKNFFSTK